MFKIVSEGSGAGAEYKLAPRERPRLFVAAKNASLAELVQTSAMEIRSLAQLGSVEAADAQVTIFMFSFFIIPRLHPMYWTRASGIDNFWCPVMEITFSPPTCYDS